MSLSGKWNALVRKFSKVTNKLKYNLKCKASPSKPEKEEGESVVLAPVEQTNYALCYDKSSTSRDSIDEASSDEESVGVVTLTVRQQIIAEKQIMDRVRPYIGETILVWCPEAVLSGDYVASLLSEFGEVEEVLNRWVPQSQFSTQADFGGMVVQYKTRDMAMNAVRGLHIRSRFVHSIILTTILAYLADSEIHHPELHKNSTCLIIRSTVPMKDRKYEHLRNYLFSIGHVNDIIDERSGENSTICKAWFVYASQAYIAMLLLNECNFYLTPLKVYVRKTTKEKEILSEIKQKICIYMKRNYLP